MNKKIYAIAGSLHKSALFLIICGLSLSAFSATLVVNDFNTVVGNSSNVNVSNNLTLTTVQDSLDDPGSPPLASDYRGEVFFSTNDANGEYYIHKAKDNHTLSPVNGFFEDNVDECVMTDAFDSVLTSVGTRQGDVYVTDHGVSFRIGPYPTGTDFLSTGSSGSDLLPVDWTTSDRARNLSFITTGTHVYDDSETSEASYILTLDYQFGSVNEAISIPRDNGLSIADMSWSSSGDTVCNLGVVDTWCVRPHDLSAGGSRLGQTDCLCDDIEGTDDADDDKCWFLQVDVLIDSSSQLDAATLHWTDYDETATDGIGLNGPSSVSWEITESSYDELFTYKGEYGTATTELDAGGGAIWYGIGWDQSNNNGEIRVTFDCGFSSNGSDFTAGDWGLDNTIPYPFQSQTNSPAFSLASAVATAGDPAIYQNHCYGRYAEVGIYLLDTFEAGQIDTSPQIENFTLSFVRENDGDLFPEEAFPNYSGAVDCDDNSDRTYPGAGFNETNPELCREDQDQDGWGNATPSIGVAAGLDCNDSNPSVTVTYWYADCDGDDFGDATNRIVACDVVPATAGTSVCSAGADPVQWLADNTDCSDENPFAYPGAAENDSDSQCMEDLDEDGYGNDAPAPIITAGTDCNDLLSAINPAALEICDNGIDNDCNSLSDDDDANVIDQIQWCEDHDEDGYGNILSSQTLCNAPNGYILNCEDCNDDNPLQTTFCELPIFIDGFELLE